MYVPGVGVSAGWSGTCTSWGVGVCTSSLSVDVNNLVMPKYNRMLVG